MSSVLAPHPCYFTLAHWQGRCQFGQMPVKKADTFIRCSGCSLVFQGAQCLLVVHPVDRSRVPLQLPEYFHQQAKGAVSRGSSEGIEVIIPADSGNQDFTQVLTDQLSVQK